MIYMCHLHEPRCSWLIPQEVEYRYLVIPL